MNKEFEKWLVKELEKIRDKYISESKRITIDGEVIAVFNISKCIDYGFDIIYISNREIKKLAISIPKSAKLPEIGDTVRIFGAFVKGTSMCDFINAKRFVILKRKK